MYHLIKNEQPFTNYPKLLQLQKKNCVPELLDNQISRSYATDDTGALFGDYIGEVTVDSNIVETDASVIEEEAIYVLFLDDGIPKTKYFSIENIKHGNAEGLNDAIKTAFERFGIKKFENSIVGLNCDGANVNIGINNGLGKLVKDSAPWLELVHCFNHRIELALKDVFEKTFFSKIENMLTKLYYLYQKSPKRYRELKELSEAYEKTITKPAKAHGTRWIDHKFYAMTKVLPNYGAYIAHLESLSQTDSQALNRSELEGHSKKWKDAMYPMYMAIYLDILSPIRRISLAMQQELHNPVKVIKRIQEFNWTMMKLVIVLDKALNEGTVLTHYKKFLDSVKINADGKPTYQGIQLNWYKRTKKLIQNHYLRTVTNISNNVQKRFKNILDSPVFKHIESLVDTFAWPIKEDCGTFGNSAIVELRNHFQTLLQNNKCDIKKIDSEWLTLKTHMIPVVQNQDRRKSNYLDIWQKIFHNESIKQECKNVLHVFEIMLIVPFTNAKVEHLFSRMNRVKTNIRNRLSRRRLDVCLRVGEEGPDVTGFDPDPVTDKWFADKTRRLTAGPHNYGKRSKNNDGSTTSYIDLDKLTMSDLESADEFESFDI